MKFILLLLSFFLCCSGFGFIRSYYPSSCEFLDFLTFPDSSRYSFSPRSSEIPDYFILDTQTVIAVIDSSKIINHKHYYDWSRFQEFISKSHILQHDFFMPPKELRYYACIHEGKIVSVVLVMYRDDIKTVYDEFCIQNDERSRMSMLVLKEMSKEKIYNSYYMTPDSLHLIGDWSAISRPDAKQIFFGRGNTSFSFFSSISALKYAKAFDDILTRKLKPEPATPEQTVMTDSAIEMIGVTLYRAQRKLESG